MDYKEKAKELVDRFIKSERVCECYCENKPNECDCTPTKIALESAKICALICVSEIQLAIMATGLPVVHVSAYFKKLVDEDVKYWELVGDEIKKL